MGGGSVRIILSSRFVPQACSASTAERGGLPAQPRLRVAKRPPASEIQVKLLAARVRRADFLEPSIFVQAQLPHAHGNYAGMSSITRTQQLRSTTNGDKRWMVASSSDAVNAGPAPEAFGRLTSRPHMPAPPLMPVLDETAAPRCQYVPEISPAATQTTFTVHDDRSRWVA